MKKVQQDIMCVLLETLLDKGLITQDVYDQSRERILGTLDWPDFFCFSADADKENQNGHT